MLTTRSLSLSKVSRLNHIYLKQCTTNHSIDTRLVTGKRYKNTISTHPNHASHCAFSTISSNIILPTATMSDSYDPNLFHYESKDGLPVAMHTLPPNTTIEQYFDMYKNVDPFQTVSQDLSDLSSSLFSVIDSEHRVVRTVARYVLDAQGKRFRPVVVLLMARALAGFLPENDIVGEDDNVNEVLTVTQPYVSPDLHNNNKDETTCFATTPMPIRSLSLMSLYERQRRLCEITELIHVASLYHDDVVDEATLRRNRPSANVVFGNKLTVYGGVFLLARASMLLTVLKNHEATRLIAKVMDQLVKGEILQMKDKRANVQGKLHGNLDAYITKTYYKTASLIANACQAVAVLGGHTPQQQQLAFEYGKNLGIAFQLVDDVIDYTCTSEELGKPAMNDLRQGIATGPVLYAAEQFPELYDMMARKFKHEGDVDRAIAMVHEAKGIEKTQALARACCENAIAAALQMPPSEARNALIKLVQKVLYRKK